jgi:hypothetical protein
MPRRPRFPATVHPEKLIAQKKKKQQSGFNPLRNFLCVSDSYRSSLYDVLEATHPEAFYDGEDYSKLAQASEMMSAFLRQELKKAKINVNEDVFMMLFLDFIGSHHFYARRDAFKRKTA